MESSTGSTAAVPLAVPRPSFQARLPKFRPQVCLEVQGSYNQVISVVINHSEAPRLDLGYKSIVATSGPSLNLGLKYSLANFTQGTSTLTWLAATVIESLREGCPRGVGKDPPILPTVPQGSVRFPKVPQVPLPLGPPSLKEIPMQLWSASSCPAPQRPHKHKDPDMVYSI